MKKYAELGIFADERGKSLFIPGQTGEIEYGPFEEPIRAKCVDTFDLPRKMSKRELDEWAKKQMEDEDSVLKNKLEKAKGGF